MVNGTSSGTKNFVYKSQSYGSHASENASEDGSGATGTAINLNRKTQGRRAGGKSHTAQYVDNLLREYREGGKAAEIDEKIKILIDSGNANDSRRDWWLGRFLKKINPCNWRKSSEAKENNGEQNGGDAKIQNPSDSQTAVANSTKRASPPAAPSIADGASPISNAVKESQSSGDNGSGNGGNGSGYGSTIELSGNGSAAAGEIFSLKNVVVEYNDRILKGLFSMAHDEGKNSEILIWEIEENSKLLAELSDLINQLSILSSRTEAEASEYERKNQRNESWSNFLGGGASAVALLSTGEVAGQIGKLVGSMADGLLSLVSESPKFNAILKSKDSKLMQAEIQKLKDVQNIINLENSTKQHLLSTSTQKYNMYLTVIQAIIAALNEARKAVRLS